MGGGHTDGQLIDTLTTTDNLHKVQAFNKDGTEEELTKVLVQSKTSIIMLLNNN